MPTQTYTLSLPTPLTAGAIQAYRDQSFSFTTLDTANKPTNCTAVTDSVYSTMKTTLNSNISSLNELSANLSLSTTAQNTDISGTAGLSNLQYFLGLGSNSTPADSNILSKNFATEKLYYELAANCKDSPDPTITSYTEQKKKTETAKLRLESIQSPEEKVSYYESWFPLNRPLNDTSLFVLFSLSILFLLVAVSMFLRMGGVEFNFLAEPSGGFAAFLAQLGFMFETYRLPIFYGIGTGAIIGSVGMYLYTKYA